MGGGSRVLGGGFGEVGGNRLGWPPGASATDSSLVLQAGLTVASLPQTKRQAWKTRDSPHMP